ncbi:MAG: CBS domain-containing protein [Planctomycetota bacterium]
MTTIQKTTARDLMRTEVLTLSPDDTIESALALLSDAGISGAPVLGSDGRLLGALSLADIARPEHVDGDRITTMRGDNSRIAGSDDEEDEFDSEEKILKKEDYSPALLGRTLVSEWMSDTVVCVSPEDSLRTLCRTLVDAGSHRAFVTERGRMVGLVSTMDVMRLLATRD